MRWKNVYSIQYDFVANLFRKLYTKLHQNTPSFIKYITETVWFLFFWTQCTFYIQHSTIKQHTCPGARKVGFRTVVLSRVLAANRITKSIGLSCTERTMMSYRSCWLMRSTNMFERNAARFVSYIVRVHVSFDGSKVRNLSREVASLPEPEKQCALNDTTSNGRRSRSLCSINSWHTCQGHKVVYVTSACLSGFYNLNTKIRIIFTFLYTNRFVPATSMLLR